MPMHPTREEILTAVGDLMIDTGMVDRPVPPDLPTISLSEFDSIDRLDLYFRIERQLGIRFGAGRIYLEDRLNSVGGQGNQRLPTVDDLVDQISQAMSPQT